jgi:S1-C subfamily serine protease
MSESPSTKFIALVTIVAAPFALGAFLLAWAPAQQFSNTDPARDGYVAPRSISELVEKTQTSTVTVFCAPTKNGFKQGTGWAIDLPNGVEKEFPTSLITNHHVIEKCIGLEGTVTVALLFEDPVAAQIVKWDEKNDLAVLAADLDIPPLALSEYEPWPGYWTMALGSADGYEGSVAFGTVLNATTDQLLLTTNISKGNSGGPVVDNEGNVVGVVTWGSKTEQYNGAMSLNAFCAEILQCEKDYYWKRNE